MELRRLDNIGAVRKITSPILEDTVAERHPKRISTQLI
ncbi:hypothetical protein TUZN_0561 [Thermoproteus uzoniensis 768-20]|uniref:Uncharacterized protein n=1 Tax=Thermoproteus uzoniensis (strain 768-20) TaxID=999630 RepID=F2L3S1_THEU7|nr:hypothetical protein TUZN_0561 [Thermoproteus uzoniensis 768-20]